MVVAVILVMALNSRYFWYEKLIDPGQLYNPDSDYIQARMSGILPDYLPPNIDWEKYKPIEHVIEAIGERVNIEIVKDKTQEIQAKISSDEPVLVRVNRFVFPNWHIYIDDQEINCEVKDYVYNCPVPEGQHQLDIIWLEKGINQYSNIISLAAFFIMGLFIIFPVFEKPLEKTA